MHLPRNLLDRPAEEAARLIGLAYLDQAGAARKRLKDDDPEGLHDFRVGIRRLRTCLRSFRRELRGSVSGRSRRLLRRLAGATRKSRDLEVHRAWAEAEMEALNHRQRSGVSWLIKGLEKRKKKADRRLERVIARSFVPLRKKLRRELQRYRIDVRVDQNHGGNSAAPAIGRQVERLGGDVEGRLAAIHAITQQGAAHEARIQVKRLRYILETIEGRSEVVSRVVGQLRSLQDILGDLHDAQVFMAELDDAREEASREQIRAERKARGAARELGDATDDYRPGLLALARRLTLRSRDAFRQLETEWLEGRGEEFFGMVNEIAQSLIHDLDESREIERKYLLRSIPPAARMAPADHIEQGWLPGRRIAERVRRVTAGSDEHQFRTIKAGSGIARLEIEEEMPAALFEHLWPLTEGRRVMKRRHKVTDSGLVWEIDEFDDRDLVLAEVELPSEETLVDPPEWLKPYVIREVTGEDEFVNLNLAR